MEGVERMEFDPVPRNVDDLFLSQGVRVMLYELDEDAIEKAREELKREPLPDLEKGSEDIGFVRIAAPDLRNRTNKRTPCWVRYSPR